MVKVFKDRTVLILIGLLFIGATVMIWHVARLQSDLMETMALANADLYTQALAEFRTLYTRDVVERVQGQGIKVTHDFEKDKKAIPLPATLSMKLGQSIGAHRKGAETRLYSAYPFPWRREQGGLQDDFGREAWEFLTQNPQQSFFRFEQFKGRPSLRYATADLMRASCVDCHNQHPESPKTDWKENDVRGVLEIIHPLGHVETATETGTGETFGLMAVLGLLSLGGLALVINKVHQSSWILEQRVEERTEELLQANLELKNEMHERWQAEAELARVSRQHNLILNSAGEGIYGLDLEGKTTFVNPAGAKMLGYEVEELLGVPMHATVHHTKPDGTPYPRETCPMYAAFKDGTVYKVDDEVLWRKDGTSFAVEYTSTPIWEDGRLVGAVVTFKDITERRRVEKNFQLVVESAPCGMMMVDAKGLIILVNTQTEHLFGYSRDELVGQPIEALIPERFRKNHPQHRAHFNACPSSRVMGAGRDLYGLRKDGIEIPIEIGLNPIETEKGFIVLSTILDITERKLAADKEEATRKLLQAIGGVQSQFIANIQASNVFDNVLANFLDLSQSEYGFIGEVLQTIEGNPYLKTHAITNIAWNEETRTLYEQHAPNLEFHNLNTLFGYVLSSGKSIISNDPVNDSRGGGLPKGHPPLHAFLGLPLYLDSQMVGMVGMANRPGGYEESVIEYLEPFLTVSATLIDAYRNVNLRREAEEALVQKTRALTRSNKELEDFASIASHDLQEPLRKIQAFGDRLKGKWAETLGPQGVDYLERMQHAAGRMQTLITDLLSFSRVTTKANPFVQVDLAKVANEVVSDLEIRITQVGGTVEIDDLPIIEADPTQMRQLFQNLIGNAMKFHKKDEPPLVNIQSQYVNGNHASASQDRWIRLTVSDNGIGFDEKYVEKIFGIFQRLHSHSEYEGTGVGLAICQKIAARHHGRIDVKSTLGKGTSFSITLPTVQGKDNKLT